MIHKLSMHFFISSLILQLLLTLPETAIADPDPLHDHCVADIKANKFMNGVTCIDPNYASVNHFATSALSKPANTVQFGFNLTLTNTNNLPGLNTLGLSMTRVDIAANGLVPPHSHPRASEVVILIEGGTLLVGFVDTRNRLYTQRLRSGESFVFPKGLIHFMFNVDAKKPALAISGLSSQNPGLQVSSSALFTSKPLIPDVVLQNGFKIDGQDVARIRRNLGG